MGCRLIIVLGGCAALAVAPSGALAQSAFPDYRQAAADQYPTQPPPGETGSSQATGGSSGNPRPVTKPHRPGNATHHNASAVKPSNAAGGGAPVAVPSRPVPAAKGSLPFTGSDLSGVVVLALILLATGFLLAAGERATRRRRRHARRAPA